MIRFGYQNKVGVLLRSIVAVLIGIVMVVSPSSALHTVVQIIAVLLIISAIVSFYAGYKKGKTNEGSLMSFNAVVNLGLGVVLFIFPGFVARFIIAILGFMLLFFGLFQVISLLSAIKTVNIPMASFIIPILVTLAGGFLIFNPFADSVMVMIAGVSLIVYGVGDLLSAWKMRQAMDVTDNVDEQ